jgi:hypothetical protein
LSCQEEQSGKRRTVEGRAANHFELAFTDYEFLLDFGQAYDPSDEPLLHTRIIMTPRSAITLSKMLTDLIEKYETRAADSPQGAE